MITKGQKINDRYEIIKSIGEGGMANVYLAHDIILDRKVAIKVLRGDLANDEKFIRRFQREALSASSLSHQSIVEMYDVGEDNGNYFIVMEYVAGRTLKQLLKKRGSLTVSEAVDILLQLTDGIAHAHDSYIIHRDLKPQNIMIEENGAIKITDFGIAMALNSSQLTQTNSVMGSVHYLPPEQASGKGSTIKSDIYSMGIVFYELLTGTLPFRGENAVEIALKHMKDNIPSAKKLIPSIPQSVENIILRSTAKNPKNRYNDVKEMHNDLMHALDPDVENQAKYVYKFPEYEPLDPPVVTEKKKDKVKVDIDSSETGEIVKEIPKEPVKKVNVVIWILIVIVMLGGVGVIVVTVIMPMTNVTPTEKVIDVSGLSVTDARVALTNLGFIVEKDTIKIASEDIQEGFVVKTDPAAQRVRKVGTKITLYESTGKDTFVVENYVGQKYYEVQAKLEHLGVEVIIEKKTVTLTDDMDTQLIIEQSIGVGDRMSKSDSITLYIPDAYEEYPDFVSEGWLVDDVQTFCDKYNIKLVVKYEESSDFPEGTVKYQSRVGKIVDGVSLTITVTKLPEAIVNPGGPTDGDEDDL